MAWSDGNQRNGGKELAIMAGRGAPTAGGGEWRTAAALCLRNPSEKREERERRDVGRAVLLKQAQKQLHETAPAHIAAIPYHAT
jgi:hypothetical protein